MLSGPRGSRRSGTTNDEGGAGVSAASLTSADAPAPEKTRRQVRPASKPPSKRVPKPRSKRVPKQQSKRPPKPTAQQSQTAKRPAASGPSARGPWKFAWLSLVTALCMLGGLGMVLYPSISAWVSQYNQSNIVFDQTRANTEKARAELDELWAEAHEYNDQLTSDAQLQAGSNLAQGTGVEETGLDYWDLLRPGPSDVMARLRVPAIDLDLPVFHGTSDATLLQGVGHLQGTSLPVGGEGTRSVLTGHRGLASATMFTNLDRVKKGDIFSVDVLDQVLTYRVTEIQVVDPDDSEGIRAVPGKDLMTLVTCTPLGINTHRILITGERVDPTPQSELDSAAQRPQVPGFPWWVLLLVAGVGTIGVWYWRSGYSAPGNRWGLRSGRSARRMTGMPSVSRKELHAMYANEEMPRPAAAPAADPAAPTQPGRPERSERPKRRIPRWLRLDKVDDLALAAQREAGDSDHPAVSAHERDDRPDDTGTETEQQMTEKNPVARTATIDDQQWQVLLESLPAGTRVEGAGDAILFPDAHVESGTGHPDPGVRAQVPQASSDPAAASAAPAPLPSAVSAPKPAAFEPPAFEPAATEAAATVAAASEPAASEAAVAEAAVPEPPVSAASVLANRRKAAARAEARSSHPSAGSVSPYGFPFPGSKIRTALAERESVLAERERVLSGREDALAAETEELVEQAEQNSRRLRTAVDWETKVAEQERELLRAREEVERERERLESDRAAFESRKHREQQEFEERETRAQHVEHGLRQRVQEAEVEARERSARIDEREAALAREAAATAALRDELQQQSERLDQLRSDFAAHDEYLRRRADELERLGDEVDARREAVSREAAQCAREREELDAARSLVTAREAEVEQLRRKTQDSADLLATSATELHQQRASFLREKSELREHALQVNAYAQQVAERERALAAAQAGGDAAALRNDSLLVR